MLRLTGGRLKGITIGAPLHLKTRPTQAKLRQALFNSLQNTVPDARVLDLFAGSGALGFEALSRGSKEAVFIDDSKAACITIQKNAQILGVEEQVSVLKLPFEEVCSQQSGHFKLESFSPFDIVFADPPYDQGWEIKLLSEFSWEYHLKPGGVFCLEWGLHSRSKVRDLPEKVPFLVKVRQKNYGNTILSTYTRTEE